MISSDDTRDDTPSPAAKSAKKADWTPVTAAWSCVIDDTPEIWASFGPWLSSLIINAHVRPDRIFVHHVCDLPRDLSDLLEHLGVSTHKVPCFDSRFPHTNKIRQCATEFPDVDKVIITDVDLAFSEPLPIAMVKSELAGKLVDRPNPPLAILSDIYSATNVPQPGSVKRSFTDSNGARV